jgi:hypothetical protein
VVDRRSRRFDIPRRYRRLGLQRAAGGALEPLAELTTNPAVFRGGEAFEEMAVTGKAAGVRIENPEVTVRVTVAGQWYLAPAG